MSSVAFIVGVRNVVGISYPASSTLDSFPTRPYDFVVAVYARVENSYPDSFLSSLRYNFNIVQEWIYVRFVKAVKELKKFVRTTGLSS
jgi:hypothetical protein